MRQLLTAILILTLAGCSDSGQHYDDPWNPPTADRTYDNDPAPPKDTTAIKPNVKS